MAATLRLVRDEPDTPITMQRVAETLGTRPMSLYTHVRNREELVSLAAAQALREWDAAVPPRAAWDRQLTAWCVSLRDHIRVYPSLMLELTGQGAFQPALLEAAAVLSRILRRAGLEGRELAAALRWVPQTVIGAVVLELSRPAGLETPGQEAAAIVGSLAALSEADRRELDDVATYLVAPDLDDLFAYTVARIVDGVRAVAGDT